MIDSGGFGCIYKPALRCKNNNKRYDGISKLQIKKYGLREYKMIKSIEKELKQIPDYTNNYIVKITKCTPNTLTREDKKEMDCYALNKRNITKKNINSNLSKLISIQMEYGGQTLKSAIKNIRTFDEFMIIYQKMTIFYREGLLPMNDIGIIHSDMKLSNLVYGEYIKLIDWGFTINLNSKFAIQEKKFHFNLPFSVILLEKGSYVQMYFKNKSVTKNNVNNFVELIMEQNKHDSHLDFLKELYENLNIEHIQVYIYKYLAEVIYKYTDKKSKIFDVDTYFKEVYVHNCDVWGFMIMFVEMIDNLHTDIISHENFHPFLNMIYTLVEKYLLNIKYATEKYDTSQIYREFELLLMK